MLKFRPSNLTQKRANITFNELQLIALIEKALSDNSLRGFLFKRSSSNAKWRMKWFLLFENLLFYFDVGSSSHHQQQQSAAASASQQQCPSSSRHQPCQAAGTGGGPSHGKSQSKASSALSSLIRRQNKQQNEPQQQQKEPDWQQLEQFDQQQQQQNLRRASVAGDQTPAESISDNRNSPGCNDTARDEQDDGRQGQQVGSTGCSNQGRQRLGSEPCSGGGSSSNGQGPTLSTGDLTTCYDQSSAAALLSPQTKGDRTQNSSSISGVSGHFQAHNEQTIGRSTTTTAGKTATSSANYSSLLNRKIGVLFLEGSYCERLVDSGGNFTGHVNHNHASSSSSGGGGGGSGSAMPSASARPGSSPGPPGVMSKGMVSNVLETEASRHYNEYALGGSSNSNNKSSSCNSMQTQGLCNSAMGGGLHEESEFNCIFTLKWRKEGSKKYQFRSETEAECQTWVHAISNARYSTLLNDKEQLEQKYLHLTQIIESESTAKWQYSKQCEEFLLEIKKLRQEICLLKRQESRSNHLRLVLNKSAAIVETIMRQQSRHQRQQQASDNNNNSKVEQPEQFNRHHQRGAQTGSSPGGEPRTPGQQHTPATAAARQVYPPPSSSSSSMAAAAQQSPAPTPLARVRSMDQEQEEHEVAVRRARRCNTSMLRLASLDPQHHPLRYTSSSSGGAPHGIQLARQPQGLCKSLTRSATRPALPAGGQTAALSSSSASSSSSSSFVRRGTIQLAGLRTSGKAAPLPPPPPPPPPPLKPEKEAAEAASEQHPLRRSVSSMLAGADDEVDGHALTIELKTMFEALNNGTLLSDCLLEVENSEELKKIKKVQGFFRGWLCRRRWKQIVQEYIKSPHAELMRKRNNLVFRMVECEEEYVEQLTLLISAFLRPIKMAASSQKPALNHDELNSIFLNSETLLFLHQIFLKGLTARMESWPTLVLGDLFNMLLPMLTIYQEYVRNHHFSLQVLAECKQRDQFSLILRRLEEKPQLNGRTLETFLTYPMHQIPRYIICLHEILAHTPHNHVERKNLYEAQTKLEDLSRQMHDEVSETENIRQNLAIERMIIGGCDILLDVNQVFVRQGILLQAMEQTGKGGKGRSRLASFASRQSNKQQQQCQQQQNQHHQFQTSDFNAQFGHILSSGCSQNHVTTCDNQTALSSSSSSTRKDLIRQCFLFTNHLLLCTRTKDGKLHLLENIGRISLSEVTLIENPLEFVQQQETIIANFDANPQQQAPTNNHHQRLADNKNNSSCNSVATTATGDCYHPATSSYNYHTEGATSQLEAKRASIVSAPPPATKWATQSSNSSSKHGPQGQATKNRKSGGSEKRNSHVEFELDSDRVGSVCSASSYSGRQLSPPATKSCKQHQDQQQQQASDTVGNHQYQLSSNLCLTDDSATSSPIKGTVGSSRRRLAGYLATKLSNLTNLASGGSGGGGQLQVAGSFSSSAPTSPLTKRTSGGNGYGISQLQHQNCATKDQGRITGGSVSGLAKHSGSHQQQQQHYGYFGQSPFYPIKDYGGCDFILLLEATSNLSGSNSSSQANTTTGSSGGSGGNSGHPIAIHLIAPNLQEKAAWMSDISQCIDNVHFNDLFHGSVNDSSSVTINQSVRTDPRLYKDDVDIKFSRALNSCKLPQIRYASKERLFERLTDLRFLSIDFLNTFLLTYRVFTSAEDVLEALKSVHYNCERYYQQQQHHHNQQHHQSQLGQDLARDSFSVFANSSLNSLSTNTNITNTLISDQAIEENDHLATTGKAELMISPASKPSQLINDAPSTTTASQKSEAKLAQIQQVVDHQKPPSIPPRSCSSGPSQDLGFSARKLDQHHHHHHHHHQPPSTLLQPTSNKYLTAPNANQTQKRRSTISALTPITGSNSSSLVNLAMYNRQGGIEQHMMMMAPTDGHLGGDINPYESSCATSAASSLGRNSDAHSYDSNNNLDDLLALRLSVDDGSDLLSPPVVDGPLMVGDRLRSSSMTQALGQRPAIDINDNSRLNLDVPTCRQVRASSLSHVGMPIIAGNHDHTSATGNTEHWRLSYKKAAEKNKGDLMMSRLAPCGASSTASARRASSSDITFHVTLEPPPSPSPVQQQPSVEAYDTSSSARRVDLETIELQQQDKLLSVLPSPTVPPSTPVEPVSPMPEDDDPALPSGRTHKERHRSAGSKHRRSSRPSELSCNGRQPGSKTTAKPRPRSSSSDGSSSVVVASESSSKSSSSSSLSHADTKSVLSSQSESGLIQSTSSSEVSLNSESDDEAAANFKGSTRHHQHRLSNGHPSGVRRHHRNHPVKHSGGGGGAKHRDVRSKQHCHLADTTIDHDEISRRLSSRRANQQRQAAKKLTIKGIDLTETKMFDYDTSADEDKVSTSSGSEESEEQHHEIDDATTTMAKPGDEDDKSFLILTRLNSVRLDDDDDDDDDSQDEEEEVPDVGGAGLQGSEATMNDAIRGDVTLTAELATVGPQQVAASATDLDLKVEQEEEEVKSGSDAKATNQIDTDIDKKAPYEDAATPITPITQVGHPKGQQQAEQSLSRQGLQTPAQTPDISTSSAAGNISQRSQMSGAQTVVGLNSVASPSSRMTTPRSSFQQQHAANGSCDRISKAGVIVSSSTPRVSTRRSSTASAASAFAAATAASNNPILTQPPPFMKQQQQQQQSGGQLNRMSGGNEQRMSNLDYNLPPMDCLCSNFHRASVSSSHGQLNRPSMNMQHQPRPSDLQGHRASHQQQQQQQLLHYPSCIYYQQQQLATGSPSNTPSNSYPNPSHSDASSMCNSRASSRLSSCAGLEYSSYSSVAPVNLYSSASSTQQQQHLNQTMSRGPIGIPRPGNIIEQQQQHHQSLASQMIQASRYHQQASGNNQRSSTSSKRNSTQLNNRSVATLRVLSVLRHWVSKHSQDFVNDTKLSYLVQEFLQDLIMDNNLLPAEHKAALQLQQMVQKAAHSRGARVDLDLLLAAPARPSPDSIETLSALEIAEGMTYLDHKIFLAIRSEEFLGQAWMKMDKAIKAPHILLITKRFNDVSRLVSSEIIRVPELHRRVAIIEKWTNVAHICRVVHNFNGVLQICAAFTNSAVFRLKKTWDKIPKTTKTTIDQLQNLVSTDSRFRNMRDAINRCDPPSIPYVGMYLTDLSFIEEGTPNYSPDGLLNFSKMRMIAHVIREIQHLQNGSYKIELNHRVANYLLDGSRHLQDDEMYRCSLAIEPRSSGGKNGPTQLLSNSTNQYNGSTNNPTGNQQQQPNQSQQQHVQQQSMAVNSTPVKSNQSNKS